MSTKLTCISNSMTKLHHSQLNYICKTLIVNEIYFVYKLTSQILRIDNKLEILGSKFHSAFF